MRPVSPPRGLEPGDRTKIAVLIPCRNEERTIALVVQAFRAQRPDADIYVFDNNSTDRTVEEARRAEAIVGFEKRQGKGYCLRAMFRQVEADVYVMVDGDGTYPAESVHQLIAPILADEADMVVGTRLAPQSDSRFKLLNLVGNVLFRALLRVLFGVRVTDVLSGYRALSRRVVKTLPFLSRGFESETELTVKCLERGFRIVEVPVSLSARPDGTRSKIHVWRDGWLILTTMFALARDYKPLTSFGLLGMAVMGLGLIPGALVIQEFLSTGMIRRLPSAVLAASLVLAGLLIAFVGLILHTIMRRFQELDYQMEQVLESRSQAGQRQDVDREEMVEA